MPFLETLARPCPLLALAPMQDITDGTFWRVMEHYGGADLYYTEYLRVHRDSTPERPILRAIDENRTGRPVIAQMIGQDIPALVRTARVLQRHPVVGIDLNLGCPAPIVCRKDAGGGLLRHPQKIDAILRALRPEIGVRFTVKTRIGFHDPAEFDALLDIFAAHAIDAFAVHGRTVRELYRARVHLDRIRQAVARLQRLSPPHPVPVIANGNVLSVALARETLAATGAAGLMIGRGAIRNPWLFRQIREHFAGEPVFEPTLRNLHAYIRHLYEAIRAPHLREETNVARIKKYLNFIGQGIGETGDQSGDEGYIKSGNASLPSPPHKPPFLHSIRRARTERELWALCERHLDTDAPFPAEPGTRSLRCERSEQQAAQASESPAKKR